MPWRKYGSKGEEREKKMEERDCVWCWIQETHALEKERSQLREEWDAAHLKQRGQQAVKRCWVGKQRSWAAVRWCRIWHNLPLGIRWSWRSDNSYTIMGSILCYYGIFSRRYTILKLPKLCKSPISSISRRSSVQWINCELPSRGQSQKWPEEDFKVLLRSFFYTHLSIPPLSWLEAGALCFYFYLKFLIPIVLCIPRNVFTKFLSHWVLFKHVLNPLVWDQMEEMSL